MSYIEPRELILPLEIDKTAWSARQRSAHAWLLDSVAAEDMDKTLAEIDLTDEDKQKIITSANIARISFISYISELAGCQLSNEEWAQVLYELQEAQEALDAQQTEEQAT